MEWRRESGDMVVATVSHFLSTPLLSVRRLPISLLARMYAQAARLSRRGR